MKLLRYSMDLLTSAGGTAVENFDFNWGGGNQFPTGYVYAIIYKRDAVAPLDAAADISCRLMGQTQLSIWEELNFQAAGTDVFRYPMASSHEPVGGAVVNEYGAYPRYVRPWIDSQGMRISVTNGGSAKVAKFYVVVAQDMPHEDY